MENKKLSLHTLNKMGSKFYSLWALGDDPEMGTTCYGVMAITPEGKRYLQNFVGFRPIEKMGGESLIPLTLEEARSSL
jgi:hypothetical protein